MRRPHPLPSFVLVTLALALAGCGGGASDSDQEHPPVVATPTDTVPAATPTPAAAAGALDIAFAESGLVIIPRQTDVRVVRNGIAVLDDQSVSVLTLERTPGDDATRLHRWLVRSDGDVFDLLNAAPDTDVEQASFGAHGSVFWVIGRTGGLPTIQAFHTALGFSIATDDRPLVSPSVDLVPLADGAMLGIGPTSPGVSGVQRFNLPGFDDPFGNDGFVVGPRRQRDTSTNFTVAADGVDGHVFVAGTRIEGIAFFPVVLEYDDTGALVRDFGTNGIVVLPSIGNAVAIAGAPDGGVIVAVDTVGLVRLDRTGTPDPEYTHRSDGAAGTSALALAADGALTSVGATFVPDEPRRFDCGTSSGGTCLRLAPTVTRLLPDGTPDPRFGGSGVVVTDTAAPNGAQGTTYATVTLAPTNRITTAGTACSARLVCDVVIARYLDVAD